MIFGYKNIFINFILLFLLFVEIRGQLNCAEAPTPAAKIVCEQLHSWDKNARVIFLNFILNFNLF